MILILAMVALNAMFAAYELALASANPELLSKLVTQGHRWGGTAALTMKARMDASLAVVQLGITLVGAVAAAVGGAEADETVSPWIVANLGVREFYADFLALLLVVLPLSGFVIVAGELVPKSFAIKNPEWVCVRLSPVMQVFSLVSYPVVFLFEWTTRGMVRLVERRVGRERTEEGGAGVNELLAHARALRVGRVISAHQERVILGAGRLAHLRVRDILVPASDIKMLHADGRLIEHLVAVHVDAHTRFLVTERVGDPQAIFGYVNVKDIFFLAKTHPDNPSLREITRDILAVSAELPIGEALARMLREHAHLALVRDHGGYVHGMITLEDILEEVVGDIRDEYDRLPRTLARVGRQWLAGGGVSLGQVREAMGLPIVGRDVAAETPISDWLARMCGGNPRAGEAVKADGVHALIRKVRRKQVLEASLSFLSRPDGREDRRTAPSEKLP